MTRRAMGPLRAVVRVRCGTRMRWCRCLGGGVAPMLQNLELVENLVAVKRSNVARLCRRQPPYRPAEMHEVRLDRMGERMHPDLLRQAIAFPRVARAASGDHVVPVVGAAARQRNEVVARQRLAQLQLRGVTAAVLTAIPK